MGGDDTGIYYNRLGRKNFFAALKKCRKKISIGRGTKLVPQYFNAGLISYQSLYDTINPDGDYNIFPFHEYFNRLKLSKKQLFREYSSIKKPTLVVYGEKDEFCNHKVEDILALLRQKAGSPQKFTFVLIPEADHGFSGKESELTHTIINWLQKQK